MELLAPAGNLEKLKWALAYGADAVYFGTEFGSLRSFAGNLSFEEAQTAIDLTHAQARKAYVTLNIYPFTEEYDQLRQTALILDEMGIDAFIVADLGVLFALKQLGVKAVLHLSTQANTTSSATVAAYQELGVRRVNLARELSLEQIQAIIRGIDGPMETEVFVHGAVCFSYSGRCAISDYLTGYRANHGECKHPCRWSYHLVEEKRPNEYMPVFEDERGLYLFNSKDLALFEFVPALRQAGVTSFKIEGRMKSIHYVASTVAFYRQILDGKPVTRAQGFQWLSRLPHRGYSAGFMKGAITPDDYSPGQSKSHATSVFVGNVSGHTDQGESIVEVRNKIHAGDSLEVLTPDGNLSELQLTTPLMTTQGDCVDFVNNSPYVLVNDTLPIYTILRRVLKTSLP